MMNERKVDGFEFYSDLDNFSDRLFRPHGQGLGEILILTQDDGTATEAILPIEEYRRLLRLAAAVRGRGTGVSK